MLWVWQIYYFHMYKGAYVSQRIIRLRSQGKSLCEYKQAFASTNNSDRDLESSEVVGVAILYLVSWVFGDIGERTLNKRTWCRSNGCFNDLTLSLDFCICIYIDT